ncbi:MAG: HIT family protein [Bacilli bacterium]|nr:HIT family protein [Bacilli bacterium]
MDCLFCNIINGTKESKKIYEDDKVIGIMDAFPNVDGHVLLIPKKHITDFKELDSDTLNHMYEVSKTLTDKLMTKLDKKAITLLVNYGESQVIKHLHLHLLPNYGKEMEAKSSPDEIYDKLKK